MLAIGQRIRCVKRANGDIASYHVSRHGTIMKKGQKEDGMQTYVVKMDSRLSPLTLWEDEMVAVTRTRKKRF